MEIRLRMLTAGLRYEDVARAIGIRSETLSRWMRNPLTQERRERILYAIACLEERRGVSDGE